MKALFNFVFFSIISCNIQGQSSWQEYLSHEYFSTINNGHLFIEGELTVVNLKSAYSISGNQKSELMLEYPPFMYQKIKTTRTGIDSKELLLLEAFDYDFSGLGLTSLRNNKGSFWGKEQFGYEEFDFEYQTVPDGIISPDAIYDQVIDHNGDLTRLINGTIEKTSPSPANHFHEGLDDNFFMIRNDSLFSYTNESSSFVFVLPTGYTSLDNDPYRNSLVVRVDNDFTWYSYDDFNEVHSTEITHNIIGSLQFEAFGFYTLSEWEDGYYIIKHDVNGIQTAQTIYTLLSTDIPRFSISSFEVDSLDIYFIGNYRNDIGVVHHYVQKRTIGQPFEPIRQDLAIDSFGINQINDQEWNNYAYTITVRNNGTEDINSFSISTNILPVFHHTFSFIREHFDVAIKPGESYSFTDTIGIFASPNAMEIFVTGVNYGIDANPENDSYLTDVGSLSNNNLSTINIEVYPNPASNLLYIDGDIDKDSIVKIYSSSGQQIICSRIETDLLDIEKLQPGNYFISIQSGKGKTSKQFIKK